jgi:hypothetical protein
MCNTNILEYINQRCGNNVTMLPYVTECRQGEGGEHKINFHKRYSRLQLKVNSVVAPSCIRLDVKLYYCTTDRYL